MGVKERRGSCRKTKGPLGQSGSSVAKKGGIKMFRNQETHIYRFQLSKLSIFRAARTMAYCARERAGAMGWSKGWEGGPGARQVEWWIG